MTSFSEQFSAARKNQLEVQLDVFRSFSTRALASTEQLIALNLKASRQSVEQAAGVFRHLLEARDPRDLFAVGSVAQGQWQNLFSYSRELMGIAAGSAGVPGLRAPLALLPAPTATLPASPSNAAEQAAIAAASATTVVSEIAAAAADTGAALAEAALDAAARPLDAVAAPAVEAAAAPARGQEAVAAAGAAVETALSDEVPGATANPVVQALHEAAPLPAGAAHPLASTVPLEAAGQIGAPPSAPAPMIKPRTSRRK